MVDALSPNVVLRRFSRGAGNCLCLNCLGKATKFQDSSTTSPRNEGPIRQSEAVSKAAETADVLGDASNALGIQAQMGCIGQC